MKLQNTSDQIKAIADALRPLSVSLFTHKSCDPKYDAQQNLSGRTHYVEDDTLRWHHSRINGARIVEGSHGLLYRIAESCALDMHNRNRGSRCVVFDVFGTTVYHPDLENTFSTSDKARKACDATPFDLVAHYARAIADKLSYAKRELAALENIETALQEIQGATLATA